MITFYCIAEESGNVPCDEQCLVCLEAEIKALKNIEVNEE